MAPRRFVMAAAVDEQVEAELARRGFMHHPSVWHARATWW